MQTNTLIHLVSEQTMQNLLPVLALRPARVIQIRSNGPRFEQAAENIVSASREAGVQAEFIDHPLDTDFPDVHDARLAVKSCLARYSDSVLNVTGGTKLMSTGAFLEANESGSPVLYCDTDRLGFISLGKTPLPHLPNFQVTASSLTLRTVMAAHGKSPGAWRFDTAAPALLAFGEVAFHLRFGEHTAFDNIQFSKRIRDFFRSDKGRIPSGSSKLQALVQADILSAMQDPVPRPVAAFLDAATTAGILERSGGKLHLATPAAGANLRSHVERAANLLDGSWLELTVLQLVKQSTKYADAHWSVEPKVSLAQPDAASFGETDVVCLTLPQGALQVISCKSTLEKPLEHLEALRERATNLGGRFARAMLVVLNVRPEVMDQLRRWGRLINVEILMGEEVKSLSATGKP